MQTKYNKFEKLYRKTMKYLKENAADANLASNGFIEFTCFRFKPAFFQSSCFKNLSPDLQKEIKRLNDWTDSSGVRHYFKIKKVQRQHSGPDIKGSTDTNTPNLDLIVVSGLYKTLIFSIPADWNYIEKCDWGINQPPVLSVDNPDLVRGGREIQKPVPVNDEDFKNIGNSPIDRSLKNKNL